MTTALGSRPLVGLGAASKCRSQHIGRCRCQSQENRGAYRIRQLREEDVPHVARLCYDAFKPRSGMGFQFKGASLGDIIRSIATLPIQLLIPSPSAQTEAEWRLQFSKAIEAKRRAREEFWFIQDLDERTKLKQRLRQQYKARRSRGESTSRTVGYTNQHGQYRRPMSTLLRKLFILVVEHRESGKVIGCASLSMARCESALPPPFPTSTPFRCYMSNIVVDPIHQNNGMGTALVQQCERIAQLWGEQSIWLHVDSYNIPAISLYGKLGFESVDYFALYGDGTTQLRKKAVEPCSRQSPPPSAGPDDDHVNADGSSTAVGKLNEKKVFVWD